MAEGIDFADDMARTVCVMGIPFPNLYDARVKTKKEFLDARNEPGGLKGADWYRLEAFRAVNQVSIRPRPSLCLRLGRFHGDCISGKR